MVVKAAEPVAAQSDVESKAAAAETPADAPESEYVRGLKRRIRELRVNGDYMDLFGDPVPDELKTHYKVKDIDGRLSRNIQGKYRRRPYNMRRCWNRVQLFLPELMHHDGPKQRVLEMSTAHGGMLEVLRYFGHDVTGNDYVNLVSSQENSRALFRDLNDPDFKRTVDDYGLPVPQSGEPVADWPYRSIIESIDIPMRLFDGGQVPYPIEEKAYDVLLCLQSIDHYCHPKDWLPIVDEFCRVTRKTIVLVLNQVVQNLNGLPEDYYEAHRRARYGLRSYRRNGFVCTSCHMMWGEPLGFKLTAE